MCNITLSIYKNYHRLLMARNLIRGLSYFLISLYKMKHLINSKYISLIIQVIAGIIGIYALTHKVLPEHIAIKQSLTIEMIVQAIQISAYIWLILTLHLSSMALKRYLDWFITTPLMLISIMLYLKYEHENTKKENREDIFDIFKFIQEDLNIIAIVLVANFVMLILGILGELGIINKILATFLGFIAFGIAFGIIYKKYASKTKVGTIVFIPIFIIWSLYGVAYMFQDIQKNIFYNVLDIFAKNIFGIFLSIKVLTTS
jgi:bacteriorhodopsin